MGRIIERVSGTSSAFFDIDFFSIYVSITSNHKIHERTADYPLDNYWNGTTLKEYLTRAFIVSEPIDKAKS